MENWESYVRKVVPYVPGEQPQEERMIKLNTNENPYPPAPEVQRALAGFNPDTLRLYPEPTCKGKGFGKRISHQGIAVIFCQKILLIPVIHEFPVRLVRDQVNIGSKFSLLFL